MNNDIKISVIIPVYNVENFVQKCFDSISRQSYSNLEVICIDDGSTDNSGKICDNWAKNDKRFKVFHKKNEGVSIARNYGISVASGDYITFVDSDDYIDNIMYEELLKSVNYTNEYDIVASGAYYETETGNIFEDTTTCQLGNNIIGKNNSLINVFNGCLGAVIWNKLFKSEVIKNNNIEFESSIYSCEDLLFLCEVVQHSNQIYYCNKSFYHYIKRKSSVTNSKFNKKLLSALDAYKKIEKMISKKDLELYYTFQYSEASTIGGLIFKLISSKEDKKIIKKLHNKLVQKKEYIFKLNSISFKSKLMLKLMIFNPYVASFAWRGYKLYRSKKYKY